MRWLEFDAATARGGERVGHGKEALRAIAGRSAGGAGRVALRRSNRLLDGWSASRSDVAKGKAAMSS